MVNCYGAVVLARPFQDADHKAYAALLQTLGVDHRSSEERRQQDAQQGKPERWVAVSRRGVLAAAALLPHYGYGAKRRVLKLHWRPGHESRVTGVLALALMYARQQGLEQLLCLINQSAGEVIELLRAKEFTEKYTDQKVSLTLADFDPAPFLAAARRAAQAGYDIVSIAELSADPDWQQRLYQLDLKLRQDVPGTAGFWQSLEQFQDSLDEAFRPDGYFIARLQEEWVGLHRVWMNPGGPRIGLTAVLPTHRGHGLATALKLRGIAFAQSSGFPTLATENESNNHAIVALNRRMGFRVVGGTVHLLWKLEPY